MIPLKHLSIDRNQFVGMMIFGSWILTQLTEYITDLWSNFGVFLS